MGLGSLENIMKESLNVTVKMLAAGGLILILGMSLTRYHDWREIVGLVLITSSAMTVGWFGRILQEIELELKDSRRIVKLKEEEK